MSLISETKNSLQLQRRFVPEGVDPYSLVEWTKKDAVIKNYKTGNISFEQKDVEVPVFWKDNSINVLAEKYFWGEQNTDERETSLKQVVDRIVDTFAEASIQYGYLDEENAIIFSNELKYALITQKFAFNSPVWFNIGVQKYKSGAEVPKQISACFILSVEDNIQSILNWYKEEGIIFKGGSGSGVNLSVLRGSNETLSGKGKASGPVSFMRGADSSAGTIKSGGKCLAPWTKVYTIEKGAVAVEDLAELGTDFTVLSYSPQKQCFVSNKAKAFKSGKKPLLNLITDNGEFDITPDHPVRLTNGEYIKAADLNSSMTICGLSIDCYNDIENKVYNFIKIQDIGNGELFDVFDVEVDDNSPDDRSILDGHNFVIWSNNATDYNVGSGIVVHNTRRAAKMVILDGDHPDIEDFIWCKALEERKARVLRDAGYDMNLDGKDSFSIQYQNANNSVRLTDEFMRAVEEDDNWNLLSRKDGSITKTVKARELLRQIAEAAWECADPGVQFDTTINKWHTAPNAGRINASNPCFTSDTLIAVTDQRRAVPIKDLVGQDTEVFTGNLEGKVDMGIMRNIRLTRQNADVYKVTLSDGSYFRATDDHRIMLISGIYTHVKDLYHEDILMPFASTLTADGLCHTISGADWDISNLRVISVDFDGQEDVYDGEVPGHNNFVVITKENHDTGVLTGFVSHNCSEYMHLDNSSCNLASLNILNFLNDDNTFDIETFAHITSLVFLAQDIGICFADYPTETIGDNTRKFREIGIGHANVGAALMAMGVAYDSDLGRDFAASVTSLLTAVSYATSADIAKIVGPFDGYSINKDAIQKVLKMHLDEAIKADEKNIELANSHVALQVDINKGIHAKAIEYWKYANNECSVSGVRNSQASVLAPTGTIGILMGCDATGIEPSLGLMTTKKLVGGGTMQFTAQEIPRGLKSLGYSEDQIVDISTYLDKNMGNIIGAPYLNEEDTKVFQTSMGENVISPQGHIDMMSAVQPFLSGAISKTVNLPEETTIDNIYDTIVYAWQKGIKALAVYRDNCKVAQPLSVSKKELTPIEDSKSAPLPPRRRRMPRRRKSDTTAFRVADCEGYMTVGLYEDGSPGELFINISKQGSTLSGILDNFGIVFSLGLQHGVPLVTFIRKHINQRFEPSGMTNDPDIPLTSSLIDYIVRRLALDYLPYEDREAYGIFTTAERKLQVRDDYSANVINLDEEENLEDTETGYGDIHYATHSLEQPVDSPPQVHKDILYNLCYECGNPMQKAGACYVCPACGSTSGCS